MTSFIEEIRNIIYFKLDSFQDIFDCFYFYSIKEFS